MDALLGTGSVHRIQVKRAGSFDGLVRRIFWILRSEKKAKTGEKP